MTITTVSDQLLDLVQVRALTKSGRAREIRVAAGLSLADVAGAIGVSPACVQRWERDLRRPYGDPALRFGALLAALSDHLNDNDPAGETGSRSIPPGMATDAANKS
jgi:DNA-binding transcriptional regulator YiaG